MKLNDLVLTVVVTDGGTSKAKGGNKLIWTDLQIFGTKVHVQIDNQELNLFPDSPCRPAAVPLKKKEVKKRKKCIC
jgi:hypothetical protein